MTCAEHGDYPCTYHDRLTEANSKLWTVVGEWSIATPGEFGCDGQAYFASQQIAAFEEAEGWIMWAHYNGQGMMEWSFQHSYENGWIDPAGNNIRQCPTEETTLPVEETTTAPTTTPATTASTTTQATTPDGSNSSIFLFNKFQIMILMIATISCLSIF